MLSRVADNLYWMSRYLERAEHTVRLLDVNLSLMLDEGPTGADLRWQRMIAALGHPKTVVFGGDAYSLSHRLIFDRDLPSSVLSCIVSARENARNVREQISTEMWQKLNSLYLHVTRPDLELHPSKIDDMEEPTDFLQSVMEAVHQFQGVTDSTLSHGEGWQFIQVGRYMERATATAMLLEVYKDFWSGHDRLPEEHEYLEWIGLLRCCTAFEAYCKVYTADITPDRILEFLLLNAEFPHSVRFSIDSLQTALDAIRRGAGRDSVMAGTGELTRLAGRLQSSLRFNQVGEILSHDVVSTLRQIVGECRAIHRTIYSLYIHYSIQAALAG
jgi:uncharacterized alpha-E superfamily protein